jgi:hypothetical protein
MMRHYVYKAADGAVQRQISLYLISSLSFRGLEYLSFLIVHTIFGVQYLVSIIAVLGGSFFAKFFWYRKFIFIRKSTQPTNTEGRAIF